MNNTMIPFNPRNWYFLATDGRVFSTATMAEVPASDATYSAWLGMGLAPSPWPGGQAAADIRAALAPYGWPCGPITRRQFFQQLAVQSIITNDEALASGVTIPAALARLIGGMPSDQQFNAKMLVMYAPEFLRDHPVTVAIGKAFGWDGARIDAFFNAASRL